MQKRAQKSPVFVIAIGCRHVIVHAPSNMQSNATMTVDGRMDLITKDMFRQQFTDFVQDLDEMTLCELIIGHSAIGYSSDLGCYVTDLDDPDRVWCGGLTRADTRLILAELRTISCALSASQEDFGDPLEEVGPDMHLAVEYVAATHAMVCAFHAIRPPVPPTFGRRFHRHSATHSTGIRPGQSERSDAGGALLLGG